MKKTNNIRTILLVLLFFGVVAYMGYTIFGMKANHPEEECTEITVIMDEQGNEFITEAMVRKMLVESKVNPIGKKVKDIDMDGVKKTLEKNPFIMEVSCYTTNNGMEVGTAKLCVKVVQSFPVLLVFEDEKLPYYLDNNGKVVNTDSLYVKNLLVANGDLDQGYAKKLAPLALYISKDDFWNNQIEQIYVQKLANDVRKLTLIPRVGNQKILFGTIDNYEKKLIRLRKFYDKAMTTVGWNKYSELNLEYADQVVAVMNGYETVMQLPDTLKTPVDNQEKTDSIKMEKTPESQKKEEPKTDVKKEEPKTDVKKEEPKKEEKKDEKKDNPNKEAVKKEEPKKDVKKDTPKKEEPKKQGQQSKTNQNNSNQRPTKPNN